MDLIDQFDENDNLIGEPIERQEAHEKGIWHRAAHVWVINDDCQILLQLRSKNKQFGPGLWDASAAGHVDAGESVITSALRELEEELGIKAKERELKYILTIKTSNKLPKQGLIDNEIKYAYIYHFNGRQQDIKISEEEVEKIEFFNIRHIEQEINDAEKKNNYCSPQHEYWKVALKKIKEEVR